MATSDYEHSQHSEVDLGDSEDEASGSSSEVGSSNSGVDRHRVAQWEDEDDLVDMSSGEELQQPKLGSSKKPEENIRNIQNNLSSLSYASLLKARRSLAQAEANSDDESDSESEESADEETNKQKAYSSKIDRKGAPQKRKNKHAPAEMSAKTPVSRKKVAVDVKKTVHRDPRFSALSGDLSLHKFQSQYSFLAGLHATELSTLKDNLKRAKKMLRSSPRNLREAREAEVQRLEVAVKRAESSVNRDRQEQVARIAMDNVKKEEQGRREQGKTGYWLKDSAKKDIVLKARHDALVESGGKGAVKKAIEKRQRKINQKEKRSRPSFASRAPTAQSETSSRKRSHTANESNHRKRQKIS